MHSSMSDVHLASNVLLASPLFCLGLLGSLHEEAGWPDAAAMALVTSCTCLLLNYA